MVKVKFNIARREEWDDLGIPSELQLEHVPGIGDDVSFPNGVKLHVVSRVFVIQAVGLGVQGSALAHIELRCGVAKRSSDSIKNRPPTPPTTDHIDPFGR